MFTLGDRSNPLSPLTESIFRLWGQLSTIYAKREARKREISPEVA
jgi:hypothetical protein